MKGGAYQPGSLPAPLRRGLLVGIWTIGLFCIPNVAFAYIDPATTTYIIQIMTAVVITLGVTLSIVLYRLQSILMALRMFFYRLYVRVFRQKPAVVIDDGSKLMSAEPQYIYQQNVLPGEPIGASARRRLERRREGLNPGLPSTGGQKAWKALFAEQRPLRSRMLIAALLSAALSVTLFIFTMLDLLVANADTMAYLLPDIIAPILLFGLGAFIVLTLLLLVFRGRLFDILTALLLALLIGAYLQGNFLNPDLGQLTGDYIPWQNLRGQTAINLAIWLALMVVVLAVRYFFPRVFKLALLVVPALLIVVQLTALLMIIPGLGTSIPVSDSSRREVLSTKGITEVSAEQNILVFLLDRLDDDYVNDILEAEPDFFTELDGFTRFNNNITHYRWTFPSIVEMLTGYKYLCYDQGEEFLRLAYGQSRLLPNLQEAGYRVKVYSDDSVYDDIATVKPYFDNIDALDIRPDTNTALRRLLLLSAFRQAPLALKPTLWVSSGELAGLYEYGDDAHEDYKLDDVRLMRTFREHPLQANQPQKNFAFYHLMGPHTPIYMDEYAEYASEYQSSVIQQAQGSFQVVYEYLRQLRELGLYENSTIIITADHGNSGNGRGDGGGMPWNNDPNVAALFVKPAGVSGTPLAINGAPVTTENLRATVIEAAGLDHSAFGPTYFQVPQNSDLKRSFYWLVDAKGMEFRYQIFEVKGDAKNVDNWRMTDEIYPDGQLIYAIDQNQPPIGLLPHHSKNKPDERR